MRLSTAQRLSRREDYGAFNQLDGRHPWQTQVPEGHILYQVRRLETGKISYFNFELAKEMGLIPKKHPHRLNKKLEEKLLNTFCLRIINEYDQAKGLHYPDHLIKPHRYMATRYLQLQHSDKAGRTSGDGRGIWNGVVVGNGKIWDVSSRGTGVTSLAPGAVEAGEPLRSGNHRFGYGCGMAEIDELFGASIMAEIFHRNQIETERVLCIIDLGKGLGIGVRASLNLLRPAHIFLYLKQGRLEPMKRATDYLIDRVHANRIWAIRPDDPQKYTKLMNAVTVAFAKFSARLERDYIFAWMDWDGDNVLAQAGIIDYGSVRQFGLRHDQYRYDDVERMSTNLNEQKIKARELVLTFAQMTHFLQTGIKLPYGQFRNSTWLRQFDREFETACLEYFLYQMGLNTTLQKIAMNRFRREVEQLYKVHCEFERIKTYKKQHKVADGVQRPAIFNMRRALSHMAKYLCDLPMELMPLVEAQEFFSWIISSQAARKDRRLTRRRRQAMAKWQECYIQLVRKVSTPANWDRIVAELARRSELVNNEDRITGNGLIHVVDEILRYRKKGLSDAEIQKAIESFIAKQTLNPDFKGVSPAPTPADQKMTPLLQNFLTVVHGHCEDI